MIANLRIKTINRYLFIDKFVAYYANTLTNKDK